MTKKTLIVIAVMMFALSVLTACDSLGISYSDEEATKEPVKKETSILQSEKEDRPTKEELNSLNEEVGHLKSTIQAHSDTINQLNDNIAKLNVELTSKDATIQNLTVEKTKDMNVTKAIIALLIISLVLNAIFIKIKFFNKPKKEVLALPEAKLGEEADEPTPTATIEKLDDAPTPKKASKPKKPAVKKVVKPKVEKVDSLEPRRRGRPKKVAETPATEQASEGVEAPENKENQ